MRIVGKHTLPVLGTKSAKARAGENMRNLEETMAALGANRLVCKPGVYRFKTHEDMNAHTHKIIVDTVVQVNRERKNAK